MATAKSATPRLQTPTDLGADATKDISAALNAILADTFALYLKTKNFHWHASGPNFRDYHLLLDEQADQLFASTDIIAERVRKIGGNTLRSIGDAVICTDAQMNISFMNPIAEQLTGWTLSAAMSVPLEQVFRVIEDYAMSAP